MALRFSRTGFWTLGVCLAVRGLALGADADVEGRLRALEEQNRLLREQMEHQTRIIEHLKKQMDNPDAVGEAAREEDLPSRLGRVHIGGEGGVAYFHTGSEGAFPHGSFRVDEAKLFVEAPLWKDTYFFGELDLTIRETNEEFFKLGELYVDFEHLARYWSDTRWLNLRVGRIDIPFGEEYLVRDVMDNPLISHSLSDLWGVDEGIEFYGSAGDFAYVVAVQNGGHPMLEDGDSDKSIAGRISYDPWHWLHLSISGMRTGNIAVEGDELSEMWFGDGFFRSLGAPATTTRFEANLFELDAHTYWKSGHLKLAGGYVEYDDDDSASDQRRDAWYYYAEAKQDLLERVWAAARFSHIIADEGMPLVGHGDFGAFFYGPLTSDLWRLSIGLGYQWNRNLLTKVEYTREEGNLLNGGERDQNFVGAQLGFQF